MTQAAACPRLVCAGSQARALVCVLIVCVSALSIARCSAREECAAYPQAQSGRNRTHPHAHPTLRACWGTLHGAIHEVGRRPAGSTARMGKHVFCVPKNYILGSEKRRGIPCRQAAAISVPWEAFARRSQAAAQITMPPGGVENQADSRTNNMHFSMIGACFVLRQLSQRGVVALRGRRRVLHPSVASALSCTA